jgi:hypothetical protein
MIEFRDTLTGLIDEYGQIEEDQFELPKPHVIGDKRNKQVVRSLFFPFSNHSSFSLMLVKISGESS